VITFKQFLNEAEEEDQQHDSVEAAAKEFLNHCSQFPDINNPLCRLSGSAWDEKHHPLRTRVPRTRESTSRGGSAEEQEFVFSQPAWKGWPARRQSIFCSTNAESAVGTVSDDKSNLLMIFPFDGVKIAMLDDYDLNQMNVLKRSTVTDNFDGVQIDGIFGLIDDAFRIFVGTELYKEFPDHMGILDKLKLIKKVFSNGRGRFNSEANGNDEVADKFAEEANDDSWLSQLVQIAATEIPEKLTPEDWRAKLITSKDLDLPGETRECWFSGKYLSVPARYYDEFKAEVKKLKAK